MTPQECKKRLVRLGFEVGTEVEIVLNAEAICNRTAMFSLICMADPRSFLDTIRMEQGTLNRLDRLHQAGHWGSRPAEDMQFIFVQGEDFYQNLGWFLSVISPILDDVRSPTPKTQQQAA